MWIIIFVVNAHKNVLNVHPKMCVQSVNLHKAKFITSMNKNA